MHWRLALIDTAESSIDILNPVLFAVLIYAAGSARPIANSSAMLLGHTLAYALPFALVPGLVAAMGDGAQPILAKINAVLEKGADLLMPWIMLALGIYLLADALVYFSTGSPM